MKYRVFLAGDAGALSRVVSQALQLGWRPQGGVAVVYAPEVSQPLIYHQVLVREEPQDVEPTQALRQLMEEAYGALGWLQGIFQLSDRARAYKVKKLQKALAEAEVCLQPLVSEEPTAKEVEQAAWAFWTERVKALLVEAEIPLKKPDASFTYHKQMKVLYQLYLEGKSPEEVVPRLIAGTEMLDIVRTFVEVKDVKQS